VKDAKRIFGDTSDMVAYKLPVSLPYCMRMHDVVHVSLLQPYNRTARCSRLRHWHPLWWTEKKGTWWLQSWTIVILSS